MSALNWLKESYREIWAPTTAASDSVQFTVEEIADALIVTIGRTASEPGAIVFRIEGDSALLYVYGQGPMEFDLGDSSQERDTIVRILAAARDGRIRARGSRDRSGEFHADLIEVVDDDGSILERLFPPVEVPRLRRLRRQEMKQYQALV